MIDRWLEKFWDNSEVRAENILTKQDRKYTDESKLLNLARLTALSVAWEILDEYEAVLTAIWGIRLGLENSGGTPPRWCL